MDAQVSKTNASSRIDAGKRAGIFGICCNILLAVAKMAIGMASGMISVVADSVNNFSDAAASVVTLIGFALSARPADDEHPFGHARYEYISGLVVSFLVLIAGLELLRSSILKIITPEEIAVSAVTFAVLIISIAVKCAMALVYTRVGREIGSETIRAAAQDSRNDCFATGAVLIAALVMAFMQVNVDGVMGVAVSVFILFNGFALVKDTMSPLLGTIPNDALIGRIEQRILSYEGVLGAHDLMVHDYGPEHCFASVHVEVPAEESLLDCHELIDRIERDFKREEGINLLIHYDPVVSSSVSTTPENELKDFLLEAATVSGYGISIHDLKFVDSEHVMFDCVVAPQDRACEQEIIALLEGVVRDRFPGYTADIKVDHGFVSLGS